MRRITINIAALTAAFFWAGAFAPSSAYAAGGCAKRPDGACIPRLSQVAKPDFLVVARGGFHVTPSLPWDVTDLHVYSLRGRPLVQRRTAGGYVFRHPVTRRPLAYYARVHRYLRNVSDRRLLFAGWKA